MDTFRYNTANYLPLDELAKLRYTSRDFFQIYLDRLQALHNSPEPFLVALGLNDVEMFNDIFDKYISELVSVDVEIYGEPIRIEELYQLAEKMDRREILDIIFDSQTDEERRRIIRHESDP